MMTMAVEMRNRYFWHNAEYARKHTTIPLYTKTKHGSGSIYEEYKVPGHPNYPTETYTYWPVREKMNRASGKHGKVDIYLHALGKEHFTQKLIPKGPWDGAVRADVREPRGRPEQARGPGGEVGRWPHVRTLTASSRRFWARRSWPAVGPGHADAAAVSSRT